MNAVGTRKGWHKVILGLGSNINPRENLPRAVELLQQYIQIEEISRAWETPAVGQLAPDFINAALLVCTPLTVTELKNQVIRPLEAQLGRVRTEDKNAPRPIDIDILLCDNEILEPELWNQAYLAVPTAEIIPGLKNPTSAETLAQAAIRLARQTRFEPHPTVLPGLWERPE